MKELHTSQPLLLGIIGLPGAGKTRFAAEFSTMFGAPVIDLALLRRTVFGTRATTKHEEEGILRLFWLLADEQTKSKHTFILDGDLSTYAKRSDVRAFAKKAGYDVLWLWIQTSESVARDRATKQKRDATNAIITPQAFDKAVKTFEAPRSSEQHIVTSGQRTFSSQVRPILTRLAEVHESKLQPPRPIERDQPSSDRGTTDRPPRRNIFIR